MAEAEKKSFLAKVGDAWNKHRECEANKKAYGVYATDDDICTPVGSDIRTVTFKSGFGDSVYRRATVEITYNKFGQILTRKVVGDMKTMGLEEGKWGRKYFRDMD